MKSTLLQNHKSVKTQSAIYVTRHPQTGKTGKLQKWTSEVDEIFGDPVPRDVQAASAQVISGNTMTLFGEHSLHEKVSSQTPFSPCQ